MMKLPLLFLLLASCAGPSIVVTRQMGAPPVYTGHLVCTSYDELPDPSCTPGDVLPFEKDVLCVQLTKERRNVPQGVKKAILSSYGLSQEQSKGAYEIDHLVPLCLGGSNDPKNLWPEPSPAFHLKDRLEATACRKVCKGELDLQDAQHMFKTNWMAGYEHEFGTEGEP